MRVLPSLLLAMALAPGAARAEPAAAPPGPAVGDGATVRLQYTMTDDAGEVLDSNVGEAPLVYTQGRRQLVPGLERALAGMRAGEEKRVSVPPEDAYGPADPGAESEVPIAMIPADAAAVGTRLVARGPDGDTRVVRVKAVREGTVLLDLNHPLAGLTLHFAVKILGVDGPPPR